MSGLAWKPENCKFHMVDVGTLWAWLDAVNPTMAIKVDMCPHCGFTVDKVTA